MLRVCAALAAAMALSIAAASAQEKPRFIGTETCQTCHQELGAVFAKNSHHVLESDKRRGWETRSCEACHGPGSEHAGSASADAIQNPARMPAERVNQTCLQCHLNRPTHVGRIQGPHGRDQVACTSCHSMHSGPNQLVRRKPAEVNELCSSCHDAVAAEFERPHRHRLAEKAMSCVDCHNPHGSFRERSIQVAFANEAACSTCHGDLRGPFAFEHAPVREEGCAACHEPHGSANPRMLRRADQRSLCLECHANLGATQKLGGSPPALHDLRSARFQNCTICHNSIHGSNVNRTLLR